MAGSFRSPDFRTLFENAPNPYLVLDPALTIVAVSDAYCQVTLTTREDILGRGIFDVFPDNPTDVTADGVHNLRASLERVLRLGREDAMPIQRYDISKPTDQGGGFEERYWSPLNSPINDVDGKVLWIIHRVEDVTEFVRVRENGLSSDAMIDQLRKTNRALAARNDENETLRNELEQHLGQQRLLLDERAWLRAMVDHVPDYLFVKDREGRFIIANRAVADDLGHGDLSAIIGKTDFDLHAPERAAEYSKFLMEVLRTGMSLIDHDEVMILPDGRERLSSTTKVPLRDAKGEIVGVVGIARDVTARRRAEKARVASEEMARSLLDASPDTMLVLDSQGRIASASQRAIALYGYEIDELVGSSMTMLVPERLAEAYAQRFSDFANLQAGSVRADEEFFALRSDGTEVPVDIRVSHHQTAGGSAVIVSVRDISERKGIEQQLRQSQKMEAIGNLTGGLAHDFNNLLSVVIGNLDLAREGLDNAPYADELLGEALSAALRGADLTKSLLAFARRQPLKPSSIDLDDLLANTVKLLSRTFPADIEIKCRQGEAVWPVDADPIQLQASIINVMTNARDAMPGGGELVITTGTREFDEDYVALHPGLKCGDYSLIEISDTGDGMSPETLAHIFEPFFTTKHEGKGTGLGLSMVFGFMRQSGGHVEAYTELGLGTTFRLYLPRARKSPTPELKSPPLDRPVPRAAETVLAVEDNPNLRAVVVRQLTKLGYRCFEAADGPSALKVLEREHVDLLFSDVIMPGGISGYDLTEQARLRWPNIKVVLTSGFPEEKLGTMAIGAPQDVQILGKPYRRQDLDAALRSALSGGKD